MHERDFQKNLISELQSMFPEAVILKNDSSYKQGIPDLLILNGPNWAMLECKYNGGGFRPNQEWYLNKLNNMSYAKVIDENNRKEILDELQRSLKA